MADDFLAGLIPQLIDWGKSKPLPPVTLPTVRLDNGQAPPAQPTKKPAGSDLDYLARTAFGEAEGEGDPGLVAVMSAVKNRLGKRKGWDTVQSVVQAPHQFESWAAGNPRRAVMEGMDPQSDTYQHLLALAQQVMGGQSPDPTGGATLFLNPKHANPHWAQVAKPTVRVGNHSFFVEP